jgi:hypothetical protein
MSLQVEGQALIASPSVETVHEWLGRIHPRDPSFFILSRSDGGYVQCAGARLRLIVEFRRISGSSFQHFVLGRSPALNDVTSINYSGGAITVHRNEILTASDATYIFAEFYRTGDVPSAFLRRDTTFEHKRDA